MKKTMMILCMICAVFMLKAQDAPQNAPQENKNAPKIEFNKLVHDYKSVDKGGDGNCEFKFTNTGKEPLVLNNVRSSCGCTVPSWPREPILPGKTEIIKVKYNTNRVGTINKSVTVQSNASNATVVLRIKGKVVAPPPATLPEKPVNNGATPVAK